MATLALGTSLLVPTAPARAQAGALPPAVQAQAGTPLQAAGRGRLTFWGFRVYDAALWVAPGFRPEAFDRHTLVLELSYLRDFTASEIARVSIEQMRRHGNFDEAQAERWQAQLAALLPDVRSGDRLAGVHRPGQGASFFHNGQAVGTLADANFSRLFFAIWLGEATSEPQLRATLLGRLSAP